MAITKRSAGLALAVLIPGGAIAAGEPPAGPVELYGRVHLELESVEAKSGAGNDALPRRTRVTDQASLLGVRGAEQLDRDLQAWFQLETGFDPQGGGGSFAQRNSGVGLRGNWGSLMMGRWDSPFKTATIATDQFGDVTIAGIKSANQDRGNFDSRLENVVQYWSPRFAGFQVRGAVTSNEERTATLNPRTTAASLTWRRGPAYLFYAYEQHDDVSAALRRERGNAVGGSYHLGPVEVTGTYQEYDKTNLTKKKSWLASVNYQLGRNDLIYQYQHAQDGAAEGGRQPECEVNTAGYQYHFSKRTTFIALYTTIDNNDSGDCRFGAGGLGKAGQDSDGFSIGLKHVF